jgi:hypothetical protein
MLEWYHWALISLCILAGVSAWNVSRAILWLGLGAFSYVTSAWWHDAGFPYATLYGAFTNVVICVLLYKMADSKWEMGVFNCFIGMILIDLLYVCGVVKNAYDFAVGLEVVNVCAMLLIGATGILERLRSYGYDFRNSDSAVLHRIHHALHSQRSSYPHWWKH